MTARTGLWGKVSWGQEQWSRTAGQDRWDRTGGQDRWDRTGGQDRWDRTGGQDRWDRTGGQDSRDRTSRRGQLEQDLLVRLAILVSLERTEMTGLPGNVSGVRRAVDKVAWAG